MAGKKFKFRTDGNRRVGIKELVTRSVSVRGPRISVSVGIDSNFNLSNIHNIEDNILIPVQNQKGLKRGRGNKAVYYPLDTISYIATVTLQFNKSGKIVDKSLIIYEPKTLCSIDEIYCVRITSSLPKEVKEMVWENVFPFAQSRVKV